MLGALSTPSSQFSPLSQVLLVFADSLSPEVLCGCISAFLPESQSALWGSDATVAAAANAGVCLLCHFPGGVGVGCEMPLYGGVRRALS